KKMGIIEENREKLIKFIGPPLVESFQKYYNFEMDEVLEAIKAYREYFADKGIFDNQIFPGIPELLASLKDKGHRLGVATSKPTIYSEMILEHFNIDEYFDIVVGSNLDGTRVAKNEIIAVALQGLGIDNPDKVVMIGDRKHDIIGAKAHNIDSIGVLFGYGTKEELEEAGATYTVDSVVSLAELLGVKIE
ncbi:MAG: HAD-IA family hydrolase, partial [Syntrophomonadaceae bacterium]|nr:HAD-IA family hydrolase [Syntrophomonadaceae bacterium]